MSPERNGETAARAWLMDEARHEGAPGDEASAGAPRLRRACLSPGERWAIIAIVTVQFVLPVVLATHVVLQRPPFDSTVVIWLASAQVAALIAMTTSIVVTRCRKRALLREHDCMICPRCHYMLAGLEPSGQCPECGEPYDRVWLWSIWSTHLRGLSPPRGGRDTGAARRDP